MSTASLHDFGVVDADGDFFELHWEAVKNGRCRLESIVQTERGPRRTELAEITVQLWAAVSDRVARELTEGMGEDERTKKVPALKRGANRISPLIGRELAILFWALMEADGDGHTEAILHGWRELAREERWWLYAKAASPGQRKGAGWRLALFHALSETAESRASQPEATGKKKPWEWLAQGPKNSGQEKGLCIAEGNQEHRQQPEAREEGLGKQKSGRETSAKQDKDNKEKPAGKDKKDSQQKGFRQMELF